MPAQADRVIEFIETFCTLGGSYLGQLFKILPFQTEIIEKVYATDDEGRRIVRTALVGLPRKSGKSLLISAASVFGLIADPIRKAALALDNP